MNDTSINAIVQNGVVGVAGAQVVRIENLYVGSLASRAAPPIGGSGDADAPLVPQNRLRWYVSYAWADESDPTREKRVDELCDDAKRRNVEIVRDKTTLSRGDRISEFIEKIGRGDRVFIFLSEKYLHSPYCMFELFEIWRNNRQDKEKFLSHVRFFAIDGAKIGRADEWLDYTEFWQHERDNLRQKIDHIGWQDAGEEAIKRFRNMEIFAGKVSDVLALFADIVQPRTFEDFLNYGFDDLREAGSITPPPTSPSPSLAPPPLPLPLPLPSPQELNETAILALKTAIEATFTIKEFDQLVILTVGENLYKLCVPDALNGNFTTSLLLRALGNRGIVPQFLRAVRKARPDKPAILEAIDTLCPSANEEASADADTVEAVRQGVRVLDRLGKDRQDVNSIIAKSRGELAPLLQVLRNLKVYKALHDALQKLQVQQYSMLVGNLEKLGQDATARYAVSNQVELLRMLYQPIEAEARLLDEAKFRVELKWIRTLTDAVDELARAVDEMQSLAAIGPTESIRTLIRTEPPRLNSELVSSAEGLPLDSLILTIGDVISIVGLQAKDSQVLRCAKVRLESVRGDLRGRVATHDQWQDVETQLWGAANEIRGNSPASLVVFGIYWEKTKRAIGPLWGLDPLANWVVSTQRLSGALDAALGATGDNFESVKEAFGRFRTHSSLRFFAVDHALKSLCDQIVSLREPLSDMLNGQAE
jgi:TIR domain-containing protein